jgi:hypothetical protein
VGEKNWDLARETVSENQEGSRPPSLFRIARVRAIRETLRLAVEFQAEMLEKSDESQSRFGPNPFLVEYERVVCLVQHSRVDRELISDGCFMVMEELQDRNP